MRRGAACVALALLVTACTSSPGGPGGTASTPVVTTPGTALSLDPLALLGTWQVTGTGEHPLPILSLNSDNLEVWARCGAMTGSWAANSEGMIVGILFGGPPACLVGARSAANTSPAWLSSAVRFSASGRDELLLDSNGRTLARLVPAPRSETPTTMVVAPKLRAKESEALRRRLLAVVRLPSGLTPATRLELLGRWIPANRSEDHPRHMAYLSIKADGSWSGSDGCNGYYGRWAAGASGRLVVVAGPTTLVGCNNVPVGYWFQLSVVAGFQGHTLVLVDENGHVTGQLRRG